MDFIPEPAPTVQQLLACYLEAGFDCALGDEPVDRLAEPDSVPVAAAPRDIVPPRPMREIPAAMPAAPRADIALAPDEAISSAREAARTAPTLDALRALLETFDGCALKHTAASGSTTTPARAPSAPSRRSIRPICCARRPTSG